MNISVVFVSETHQHLQEFEMPEQATVQDAIEKSGILKRFPELDNAQLRLGIFGKLTKLESLLTDGDRIEIYRPIIADPRTVPRRAG